jgi:hypothetical protein
MDVQVDGKVVCEGLRLATARSEEAILCLVKGDRIKLVAVSSLRLVISWESRLGQSGSDGLAFLIPPLMAELLSGQAICGQVGVQFALRGPDVTVTLSDPLGSYELRWKSDLASFPAPDHFGQITRMPDVLMDVSYLRFSDATHEAVAKLIHMEADGQASPEKLAILIDLDFGRLRIDGQEIVLTESHQYYFDPRLVIRALEFLREKSLAVGISPLPGERQGYLSLLAEQDGWTVHCSLLSIGKDTQKLYPLSPGRKR